MSINSVLTTDEMRILDRETCERKGISSLELMELAGKNLFECLIDECNLEKNQDKICIISGVGNNGGDGLVVARYLMNHQYQVQIVIVGNSDYLTEEAKTNIERLKAMDAQIFYLKDNDKLDIYRDIIENCSFIVDAIFGIGLSRGVEGIYYHAIDIINKSRTFVFSIDIPSGINGNNGNAEKIAVMASFTAIVQNYKIGNLLNDAKDYHGKIKLLDIGILQEKISSNRFLQYEKPLLKLLKKRKNNTHKYHYGSVLTIGGNNGMTGAPLMSAYAALKTGSGLSTIAINESYINRINQLYPEIMIRCYYNDADIMNHLDKKDVISFGPGLGRNNHVNYNILKRLLKKDIPLVIDADGLFYLKSLLNKMDDHKKIIVTPHIGEMAMLLDIDTKEVISNPIDAVRKLTDNFNITVVLKGPCTIIAHKNNMFFSHSGNPGMATAGSGDVLTGIIASLVGQGFDLLKACQLGVVIHSKAGNYAKETYGEYSMIATDIVENIYKVFKGN